jgi:hypothetical protein
VGIFRHHLGGDLANADLLRFARTALGATGADVAAWTRSARRLARNDSRVMCPDDLMKQIVPDDERSAGDIRRAAYHEAGHCVAMIVLTRQKVDYVSIVSRGSSGGRTAVAPLGTDFPTREDLEKNVTIALCGRAAEEVLVGTPSVACSLSSQSDLARATNFIVAMHATWGLGKVLIVHAPFGQASALLHKDADLRRTVNEHMASIYQCALKLISNNTHAIRLIAEQLIIARHLDWSEIERTIKSTGIIPSVESIASHSIVPDPAGSPDASGGGTTTNTGSTDPASGSKSNTNKRQLRGFDP